MPRRIDITWKLKQEIFLTFRVLGKVLPTAEKHKVPRSTVDAVIRELLEAGFSARPRVSLPTEMLKELQASHLTGVASATREASLFALDPPEEYCGSSGRWRRTGSELIRPETDLSWHLKGSPTEQVLVESAGAISQYAEECSSLWESARGDLEALCGIEVVPREEAEGPVGRSRLWTSLADLAYGRLFESGGSISAGWHDEALDERQGGRSATRVRLRGVDMGVLAASDRDRLSRGIGEYESRSVPGLRARAEALRRVYRDLSYLRPIVDETLKTVAVDLIGSGICPSCPYPESTPVTAE